VSLISTGLRLLTSYFSERYQVDAGHDRARQGAEQGRQRTRHRGEVE
jgi:hypothetical protein